MRIFSLVLTSVLLLVLYNSCQSPMSQTSNSAQERAAVPGVGAFPYAPTNYDEPYRGQFHFSSQAGWLNDVNGLWYSNGTYYMTYQHYPYGLGWASMHWGMATSTDMLHWTQQPIALTPGVNVPGDCFSGSVVVDTNNTSGLKTGSNPVFVAIYTATSVGTCLAYSNDLGVTWQGYSANPVNVAGPNADTRDPHVFWYAPTNKWVAVIFENGTTFYTSPNLKTWTKTSTFNFGFECPDFFELAVDGGATKKWVIMDAALNYYIGSFNGAAFTPEAGPFQMDQNGYSGGFYASQTFYRNNFPDARVIQMGWQGANRGSVWTNNVSFPAEIRLATFPEGVRAARQPIAELSRLYAGTKTWPQQTVASGSNLLGGTQSKTFEIKAEFDVGTATANLISFNFPGVTVAYDIAHHTLLGKPLNPINNRVKLRILVDWGQLEVFANDGEFSYTANANYSLTDSSMSLSTNGNVQLISMTYNTIARTWPGAAAPGNVTDDTDAATVYSGTWNTAVNDAIYNAGTAHYGNTAGGSVQYTFAGTGVDWFGLKNSDLGYANVWLDGTLVQSSIDCYSTVRAVTKLFSVSGLTNGSHTIKVAVSGSKNAASANTYLVHDFFSVSKAVLTPAQINDTDAANTYSGTWSYFTNDTAYWNNDCHVSNAAGAFVQYTFTGTGVDWYGLKNNDLGLANVYLDGNLVQSNLDCYSTTRTVTKLFTATGLASGSHTIKVVVAGSKNAASGGTYLVHDSFAVSTAVATPTKVNDSAASNAYTGTWLTAANDGAYLNGDCHVSNAAGASVQYTFTGTAVEWYGLRNSDLGFANVFVDGVLVQGSIDCYSTVRAVGKLFSKSGLPWGSHTIKVSVAGTKNPASADTYLVHDFFSYQ